MCDWVLDDQPVPVKTRSGSLISIPYTQECNDVAMMLIQHHPASEYRTRAVDQFEQLYADAKPSARVMALVVHPYIMGAPHRLCYLREALEHIRSRPGVVFWTGEQILDWYLAAQQRATNDESTDLRSYEDELDLEDLVNPSFGENSDRQSRRQRDGASKMNFNHRAVIACVSVICVASQVFAQSNPRYVRFPGVPASVKGALYMPDAPLPAPHVGIVVMHRTSNFMTALACTELSRRGFAVLCMNPRSDNNEALVRFETIPLDVRAGVQFLKSQPGITRIVLWGWSGGGATMTLYQSVAETGVSVCQGPGKLVQCGNELAGLPPADGLILVDAHPGNPVNALRSLNGAVTE